MERRDDACPSRLDSICLFPSRENTSRERENNNSGLLRNLLRFVSSRDDATGKRAAFPLIVPQDKSRHVSALGSGTLIGLNGILSGWKLSSAIWALSGTDVQTICGRRFVPLALRFLSIT